MKRSKNGMSNLDIVRSYLKNERPFTQVGYTESSKERTEGEIWQGSNGQTFIFKNGVKKALSRPTKIVDACRLECKGCKKNMRLFNDRLDDKVFPRTGLCMDCLIAVESKLKREGKYELYEKSKIFNNQKSHCVLIKQKLEETIKYLENYDNKIKYMNEDGSQECWHDTTREKILNGAKIELKDVEKTLVDIEERLKELENGDGQNKN